MKARQQTALDLRPTSDASRLLEVLRAEPRWSGALRRLLPGCKLPRALRRAREILARLGLQIEILARADGQVRYAITPDYSSLLCRPSRRRRRRRSS